MAPGGVGAATPPSRNRATHGAMREDGIDYTVFPRGITQPGHLERRSATSLDALIRELQKLPPDSAWSAATFNPERRLAKNVESVHWLVLDIDGKHAPSGTRADAIAALPDLSLAIHTTRSHRAEAESFRPTVELSRSVTPKEYPLVWRFVAERLAGRGVKVDPAARDAARAWFIPMLDAEVVVVSGERLDVDAILAEPKMRSRAEKALDRAEKRLREALEGERNEVLFRETIRFRQAGWREFSEEQVFERFRVAAASTGLDDAEIQKTFRNAWSKPSETTFGPTIVVSGGDLARVPESSEVV